MSKIIKLTESDLTRLVKRIVKESEMILNEQATFMTIFPTVASMTAIGDRNNAAIGSNNGTNIIYLTKRDAKGNVIPNTKFSYRVGGSKGLIDFNITLRNVRRDYMGNLTGEALPDSKIIASTMKSLISKKSPEAITADGWLKIFVPRKKLDAALIELYNNKGREATIELDNEGIDITLEKIN
jgi:hypothetical protein